MATLHTDPSSRRGRWRVVTAVVFLALLAGCDPEPEAAVPTINASWLFPSTPTRTVEEIIADVLDDAGSLPPAPPVVGEVLDEYPALSEYLRTAGIQPFVAPEPWVGTDICGALNLRGADNLVAESIARTVNAFRQVGDDFRGAVGLITSVVALSCSQWMPALEDALTGR